MCYDAAMSAVSVPKDKMSVAAFHAWALVQPQGRYELVAGDVVAMAPERQRHVVVKGNVFRALQDAVRRAKLPCTVFTDGVSVVIDDETSYGPDTVVECGSALNLDSVTVANPLIVVEVTSPSSERQDTTSKAADYMTVASIAHVLIIDAAKKRVIHHERGLAGVFLTRSLREADTLRLTPPGIEVAVAALFEDV